MDTLLIRLAAALAIGLLAGTVRGWQQRSAGEHRRVAGLRTFGLAGLLGGLVGAVSLETSPIILGIGLAVFVGAFASFQWLEARFDNDVSVTSVVAAMMTFILGAYAVVGDVQIAVPAAIAMTALLALREPLHQWVASLRWEEIRATLILLGMSFLLLPLLPDRTVDPWDTLNPAEIWLFAIMIAAISFIGYVCIRKWGEQRGVILAALAGGLASSTATTLTLARLAKQRKGAERLLAGGILLSGTVMVARVGIVSMLLSDGQLIGLVPALIAAIIVQLAFGLLFVFRQESAEGPELVVTNPLELGTALKMAAAIAAVMLAAGLAERLLGEPGVLALAGVSGVLDVDAVTISMARLAGDKLTLVTAMQATGLAVAVNTVAKAAMAGFAGGRKIGAYVGMVSALALAAGATVLLAT